METMHTHLTRSTRSVTMAVLLMTGGSAPTDGLVAHYSFDQGQAFCMHKLMRKRCLKIPLILVLQRLKESEPERSG